VLLQVSLRWLPRISSKTTRDVFGRHGFGFSDKFSVDSLRLSSRRKRLSGLAAHHCRETFQCPISITTTVTCGSRWNGHRPPSAQDYPHFRGMVGRSACKRVGPMLTSAHTVCSGMRYWRATTTAMIGQVPSSAKRILATHVWCGDLSLWRVGSDAHRSVRFPNPSNQRNSRPRTDSSTMHKSIRTEYSRRTLRKRWIA